MSVTTILSDNVIQHLNGLSCGKVSNINDKLALLLEAEYRRRLARYSLTDQQLGQKYQMRFAEFERRRITEQRGYTWEVESDAMAWETAVDGVRTVRGQLNDLVGRDHVSAVCLRDH
jgi:ATP-dependent exoDNAse (exonuclease V) alpha subunit